MANGTTTNKYKLNLEIDTMVLSGRPSDNLCIARKVNGIFNVVLLGASISPTGIQTRLQVSNTFAWEDNFRAFCAIGDDHKVAVSSASNIVAIEFGQEVAFDPGKSQLTKATPAKVSAFSNGDRGQGSAEDSFILANVPSKFHAACECSVEGIGHSYPIYIDTGRHATRMDVQITPSNEYVIFWHNVLTPNAFFEYGSISEKMEFRLSEEKTEVSIRFGLNTVNTPQGDEEAEFHMT